MAEDRPRVLMVAPEPFFEARGTPMNVLQMCKVLTDAGYAVDLATYPIGQDVEMAGLALHRAVRLPGIRSVPVGYSHRKLILDLALWAKLTRLLVTRRYALIHAVEESVFLALPFTWFGSVLVYDLDSVISEQLQYSGALRNRVGLAVVAALERVALRRSRAAITVCSALTARAAELCPRLPVFQIEDTPPLETTREADPRAVAALRAQYGLQGHRVVAYTGNLAPYQRIDLLLSAARLLPRQGRPATTVLVGGGEELERLRARLAREGLAKAVLAVGRRPVEEMPEWMALADVLVSPRTDGFNTPLKIYSYMRSGTPIVATNAPAHTQVLDRSTAVLCPPTPEALAEAVGGLLADGEAGRALGARARRVVEAQYGYETFRRKLLGAYEAILGNGPAAQD